MAKTLDTETMDNIVLLREKGLTLEQAAVFCKCGHATASRVYSAYQAARDGDYDTLRSTALARSSNIVDWACAKFGITNLVIQNDAENAALDEAAKPEKPDNTATAFASLLGASNKLVSENVSFHNLMANNCAAFLEILSGIQKQLQDIDRRISAIQLTQQGFRGDVGEKIGKVIETVNVNGDILTKEHDKMIDLLGVVKSNTKRRPEC